MTSWQHLVNCVEPFSRRKGKNSDMPYVQRFLSIKSTYHRKATPSTDEVVPPQPPFLNVLVYLLVCNHLTAVFAKKKGGG